MTRSITLSLLAAAAVGALAASAAVAARAPAPVVAPAVPRTEAELLAVVTNAQAPIKDRMDACRDLQRTGTKAAVAPLAALLADEKMSHMARYALQSIPDAAVDEALRAALGRLKGLPLVGVLGTIGMRRDAQAAPLVAKFLTDADPLVVRQAARTLGDIGTPEAAMALAAMLPKAAPADQLDVCEGVFGCAEAAAAAGNPGAAAALYAALRDAPKAPQQVLAGALRGLIMVQGDKGLALMGQSLRAEDYLDFSAAIRAAIEMKEAGVTKVLADALAAVESADRKVVILRALGKRGDPAGLPAMLAAAQKGAGAVRLMAIRLLPTLPSPEAVPVLVTMVQSDDADVAKAAQESLASLPGAPVDAAIQALLADSNVRTRQAAVEVIGQRRITAAVPALVKAAESDANVGIRVAAIRAVGDMAAAAQLPALLGVLTAADSDEVRQAAEKALAAICVRESKPVAGKVVIQKAVYGALPDGPSADVTKKVADMVAKGATSIEASNGNFGDPAQGTAKQLRVDYAVDGASRTETVREQEKVEFVGRVASAECVSALTGAMAKAPTAAKPSLLRVLSAAGGEKSLDAVRAATKDADAEVKDAALRVLCEWPTPDALPDVTALARGGADNRTKVLAIRGMIRLIPQQSVAADVKLAGLKEVLGMATRTEEKRLAVAALGEVGLPAALEIVAPMIDSADLKEEACMAAVSIGGKIVDESPKPVAAAMEKVVKTTGNRRLVGQANAVLAQARQKMK
jgi:HEAT repeat protein